MRTRALILGWFSFGGGRPLARPLASFERLYREELGFEHTAVFTSPGSAFTVRHPTTARNAVRLFNRDALGRLEGGAGAKLPPYYRDVADGMFWTAGDYVKRLASGEAGIPMRDAKGGSVPSAGLFSGFASSFGR